MTNILGLNWQSLCGRYTVTLSYRCFKKMLDITQDNYPNEVGTSLIGYYSEDGFDAYIEDTTPLSSDSVGSAFSFIRGIKGLKSFYKQLIKKYKGRMYYIGDWHTHPNSSSTPSKTDDINQSAIASDKKVNCSENILVIIGGNLSKSPEIGIYVYSRKKGRISLFPQVEE